MIKTAILARESVKAKLMKILHTADLHVGDSRNLPGYLDRQQAMLYGLTEAAVAHEVGLMLICGDIFDSKYLRPRERDLFLRWVLHNDQAAERHQFRVIVINGNHDELEDGYTHLHGYTVMQAAGRFRRTHFVEVNPQTLGPFDDTYVFVVPPSRYRGNEINDVVGALRSTLEAKLEAADKPRTYRAVAMVHEGVVGAVNELGNHRVTKGVLLDPGLVDYWALGDIHKPFQQILPNAWYPGSPIQHDFGDVSPHRGCLVVDMANPTRPTPYPLAGVRPLVTLDQIPDEWPDAIVRFRGTTTDIATNRFPPTVVSFDPIVGESTVTIEMDVDLLARLPEVLADYPADLHGLITEEIESAFRMAAA